MDVYFTFIENFNSDQPHFKHSTNIRPVATILHRTNIDNDGKIFSPKNSTKAVHGLETASIWSFWKFNPCFSWSQQSGDTKEFLIRAIIQIWWACFSILHFMGQWSAAKFPFTPVFFQSLRGMSCLSYNQSSSQSQLRSVLKGCIIILKSHVSQGVPNLLFKDRKRHYIPITTHCARVAKCPFPTYRKCPSAKPCLLSRKLLLQLPCKAPLSKQL